MKSVELSESSFGSTVASITQSMLTRPSINNLYLKFLNLNTLNHLRNLDMLNPNSANKGDWTFTYFVKNHRNT